MRRGVIITTALAFAALGLGCMSFTFGGHTDMVAPHEPAATADLAKEQTGNAQVAGGEEITVYYPIPYASPPNLVMRDPNAVCRVIEQKADCFRIRNTASLTAGYNYVAWTARGVPVQPQGVSPANAPATSAAATNSVTQ